MQVNRARKRLRHKRMIIHTCCRQCRYLGYFPTPRAVIWAKRGKLRAATGRWIHDRARRQRTRPAQFVE
jgi:hypothetical protein